MGQEFFVRDKDGDKQKGRFFPAENAKYNLCIITGMNEHSGRYEPFALWLNERGVNVWVLDAIGQGLNVNSPKELEIWPENAFEKNVDAIHAMNVLAKENNLPTYQMGHSMGSFLTQSLIERYHDVVDGVILMGSNGGQAALMKTAKRLANVLVNKKNRDLPNDTLTKLALGGYAKAIKGAKTMLDWLSYNEDNVKAYDADEYCGAKNTGGFWKEFLGGMSKIWDKKEMDKVSKDENILIVSGADDPVGQNGKGVRWLYNAYKGLGVKNVRLVIYPGMRHEILNEDNHEKVYKDIFEFINGGDE